MRVVAGNVLGGDIRAVALDGNAVIAWQEEVSQPAGQTTAKSVFQGADVLTTLNGPVVEKDILGVPCTSTISIDCEPTVVACRVHIDVRTWLRYENMR